MEISRLVDPYVLLNEIYLNVVFCYTFLFSMYLLNLAAYLYTISPAENAAYIVKPLLPSKENKQLRLLTHRGFLWKLAFLT